MGVHVCRLLAAAGHDVTVTSRSARSSEVPNLSYVQGDAKKLSFLDDLLRRRWDAVIDFMVWSTIEFRGRFEALLASTDQYVFTSSYRVYADASVITEDCPRLLEVVDDEDYLATDEYALSKARCEDMLFGSETNNWTIVRPTVTYDGSKGRLQLGVLEANCWLWRALNKVPVPFPEEMLAKQTTMTYGGDAASMIARLVGNAAALGEAFTVSTSEHLSWLEVAEAYRGVLPFSVKPCSLGAFEDARGGIYQIRYDRMFDRVIDNSKILAATGMSQHEFVGMRDGLTNELSTFLARAKRIAPCGIGLNARLDQLVGGWPSFWPLVKESRSLASVGKYLFRRVGSKKSPADNRRR